MELGRQLWARITAYPEVGLAQPDCTFLIRAEFRIADNLGRALPATSHVADNWPLRAIRNVGQIFIGRRTVFRWRNSFLLSRDTPADFVEEIHHQVYMTLPFARLTAVDGH